MIRFMLALVAVAALALPSVSSGQVIVSSQRVGPFGGVRSFSTVASFSGVPAASFSAPVGSFGVSAYGGYPLGVSTLSVSPFAVRSYRSVPLGFAPLAVDPCTGATVAPVVSSAAFSSFGYHSVRSRVLLVP